MLSRGLNEVANCNAVERTFTGIEHMPSSEKIQMNEWMTRNSEISAIYPLLNVKHFQLSTKPRRVPSFRRPLFLPGSLDNL